MAAASNKGSLQSRIKAGDRAAIKRALDTPGLRRYVPDSVLNKSAQGKKILAQRSLSARLSAPIVQGSSTTERDLAHAAEAATNVRYAPQEQQVNQAIGVAQQTQQDTGSFYDQYRQALQQHAQNVAAYQAGAQAGLAATAQGITGLAGAEGAALQQQANQGAAVNGVAPAGNLLPEASNAAAIQQAFMGSFQGQQALQGANANTYADTQANVVAPGQKLAALAQAAGRTKDARQKLTDLKTEEGQYNQSFRDTRRQDEFKNVLAQQTLTGNQAIAATNAATSAAKNDPTTQASVAGAKSAASSEASTASKYGYSVHQWRLLGPDGRKRVISANKSKPSDTVYSSGPFAGKTKSEVNGLSPDARKKLVDDFNQGKGKGKTLEPSTQAKRDFRQKYGVDPLGTPAHNKARSQIQEIGQWLGRIGGNLGKAGQVLTTGQPVGKNSDGSKRPAIPKFDPVLVRAAMDIKQYGGILPGTADRLHHEGYSVASLRLKMGRKPSPYKPPGGVAGKIPGVGGN